MGPFTYASVQSCQLFAINVQNVTLRNVCEEQSENVSRIFVFIQGTGFNLANPFRSESFLSML
jgi:hypothetical protein